MALLVVWIMNDHLFKELFSNQLTGKLSDVASLSVFPLLPYCGYEVLCAWRGKPTPNRRGVLWLSLIATGAVMVGINLSPTCAYVYEVGLAAAQWPFHCLKAMVMGYPVPDVGRVELTMDPTDIWTLPSLLIPWWVVQVRR